MPAAYEHRVDAEEVAEEVADQEDEDALPVSAEDEEMEAELEDAECEGGDPLNATAEGGEPPNGMPGQLPTKKEQPLAKDYAAIKNRH
jgi:hypothetical protein